MDYLNLWFDMFLLCTYDNWYGMVYMLLVLNTFFKQGGFICYLVSELKVGILNYIIIIICYKKYTNWTQKCFR